MMPVTQRKVTVVPHSLAAVAAAICLVVSVAWDRPAQQMAEQEQAAASPTAAVMTGRDATANTAHGEEDRNGGAKETAGKSNNRDFQLIALLFPRRTGGG